MIKGRGQREEQPEHIVPPFTAVDNTAENKISKSRMITMTHSIILDIHVFWY